MSTATLSLPRRFAPTVSHDIIVSIYLFFFFTVFIFIIITVESRYLEAQGTL